MSTKVVYATDLQPLTLSLPRSRGRGRRWPSAPLGRGSIRSVHAKRASDHIGGAAARGFASRWVTARLIGLVGVACQRLAENCGMMCPSAMPGFSLILNLGSGPLFMRPLPCLDM